MEAPAGSSRRRQPPRCSLLVSTSQPSSSAAASASAAHGSGGGPLSVICPYTGTVQASTRIAGGDFDGSAAAPASASKGLVGISTLSLFPSPTAGESAVSSLAASSPQFAIGFGSNNSSSTSRQRNGSSSNDTYGMFFTVRTVDGAGMSSSSSSNCAPILHWKCRLPEATMTGGLLVSPVTACHVVGGGQSGSLFVWDLHQGSTLVRTISHAHYRAVTCMIWSTLSGTGATRTSPWDCHLVTGGADGMVHVFSHLDLVQQNERSSGSNGSTTVQPIRTWTRHQLAVTSLVSLGAGGRIASSSQDGQVVIMEICSGCTIATILLPSPIRSLCCWTVMSSRLFAGSVTGTIHCIDLDEFALHRTAQMGATVVQVPPKRARRNTAGVIEDRVFGRATASHDDTNDDNPTNNHTSESLLSPYLSELRGHERSVTAVAALDADTLVSGDEEGVLRIWDTRRACCIRVIHPWSAGAGGGNRTNSATGTTSVSGTGTNNDKKQQHRPVRISHPVTSIHVLLGSEENNTTSGGEMFGNGSERKKYSGSMASRIVPLQKFVSDRAFETVSVPFVQPRREIGVRDEPYDFQKALQAREKMSNMSVRPDNGDNEAQQISTTQKKTRTDSNAAGGIIESNKEIEHLKRQLDEAKATIDRWEAVNHKLMGRLKEATSASSAL
jgi:WD40 repeat protein